MGGDGRGVLWGDGWGAIGGGGRCDGEGGGREDVAPKGSRAQLTLLVARTCAAASKRGPKAQPPLEEACVGVRRIWADELVDVATFAHWHTHVHARARGRREAVAADGGGVGGVRHCGYLCGGGEGKGGGVRGITVLRFYLRARAGWVAPLEKRGLAGRCEADRLM